MKSLNRSMLMRLVRAVGKAQEILERNETLATLDLKRAKGPSAVRRAEEVLQCYRNPKERNRLLQQLITGELEKFFAARYVRVAKETGDDTNLIEVQAYAREEARKVLNPLL